LLVGFKKGLEKRRKCSDHSQGDEDEGDDENLLEFALALFPEEMQDNPGNEPDGNGYGRLPAERAAGDIAGAKVLLRSCHE
jgi:hypothetical protein